MRTFSLDEARAYYDRFGAKQDGQAYYEDPATEILAAHSALDTARAVFELGCGTGRLADRLLRSSLPPDATYVAADISNTMVQLATQRLRPYGARVSVRLIDGRPPLPAADASCDRFISTYVLDLLAPRDIRLVIEEAARVLTPGGLLCAVSLTQGVTASSRVLSRALAMVHAIRPSWVGGCRPLDLLEFAPEDQWERRIVQTVAPYGIPSQILVAGKR